MMAVSLGLIVGSVWAFTQTNPALGLLLASLSMAVTLTARSRRRDNE